MNSKKTLVVLAGGLGSRYNGLKQIDGIYNGATIMEYSLFDAIEAGFNSFVFIINDKVPAEFQEDLKTKLSTKNVDVKFTLQGKQDYLPKDYDASERVKPWGTAHALLCAKEATESAFFVINADDYYGKEIYKSAAQFFDNELKHDDKAVLLAFQLGKTLSENGSVSRGVCVKNDNNELITVTERTEIRKEGDEIVYSENEVKNVLAEDQPVSMNFWGFTPAFFQELEERFKVFIDSKPAIKQEYMLPVVVQELIDEKKMTVTVSESPSQWMGVTYATDREIMKNFLEDQTKKGKYPEHLWN